MHVCTCSTVQSVGWKQLIQNNQALHIHVCIIELGNESTQTCSCVAGVHVKCSTICGRNVFNAFVRLCMYTCSIFMYM